MQSWNSGDAQCNLEILRLHRTYTLQYFININPDQLTCYNVPTGCTWTVYSHWVRQFETSDSWLLGICTYCKYAVLSHLPKVCIINPFHCSSCCGPNPKTVCTVPWLTWEMASRISSAKWDRVGWLYAQINSGPGFFPRMQRKSRTTATGHSADFVQPTNRLL